MATVSHHGYRTLGRRVTRRNSSPPTISPDMNGQGPTILAGPQNKELERTRSTHFAAGPRRSIQCSTDVELGGEA